MDSSFKMSQKKIVNVVVKTHTIVISIPNVKKEGYVRGVGLARQEGYAVKLSFGLSQI